MPALRRTHQGGRPAGMSGLPRRPARPSEGDGMTETADDWAWYYDPLTAEDVRRRLTRLPSGRHAASQSVAARRHSPATRQEGHPGRHGGSPPRTPAAPVSTLRTLPAHPTLATPTLRTETTGRLRRGRLVFGVASRHAPRTDAVLQEPCSSCHWTVARRHYSRPIHSGGRRPGTAVLYPAVSCVITGEQLRHTCPVVVTELRRSGGGDVSPWLRW